jgi:hypothetical protein
VTDLVERLQAAAAEAIANERPEMERDPLRLRGVVLEFRLKRNPDRSLAIHEATCYVERQVRLPRGERA